MSGPDPVEGGGKEISENKVIRGGRGKAFHNRQWEREGGEVLSL